MTAAVFAATLVVAAAAAQSKPPVVVCKPAEVERVVRTFVDDFNRGAFRAIDRRVIAREPEFHWYSTGGPGARLGPASRNRSTLIGHLRRRRAAGDRFTLVYLLVHGNSRPSGTAPFGNFEFKLIRHPGEHPRFGKGAVYCYRSVPDRIIVWSLANPEP